MGQPEAGGQKQPTHKGVIGYGLKLGGTAQLSGADSTTSLQKITFDDVVFGTGDNKKIPLHIRFKNAAVLTVAMGDKGAVMTAAADAWTNPLPCTDLFLGKEDWWLSDATGAALQYEIYYV